MKKFKETKVGAVILRNLPLKIIALLIAIVLWIVVVNIDDPVNTHRFSNLSVSLENEQLLIDKGYTYRILGSSTVSITVKAPQTIIDELKATDFQAYADLANLTDSNTCKVDIRYTGEYESQVDITCTSYITLKIDNKISKEFTIKVDTDQMGNPETGYIVSDASVSPSTITVTGADEIIDTIDHVSVNYDITNMNQSVTDTVTPVFYDAEGNEVDISYLTCSRDTVRIDVVILPTKWISVNYALSGTPAEGYEVASDTPNVTAVQIAGTKDNLAKIDSIDIPAGGLDVTGLKEDTTLSVSLLTYLSGDYTLISETKTLSVDVKIKHMVSRDIEVAYEDIEIVGLGSGYEAMLTNGAKLISSEEEAETEAEPEQAEEGSETGERQSLVVTVYGEESVVEALTVEDLAPTVSGTSKVSGTYSVKIAMTTTEDYSIEDTYYITLIITPKAEQQTKESTSTTASGNEDAEKQTTTQSGTGGQTSTKENTSEKSTTTEGASSSTGTNTTKKDGETETGEPEL